MKKISLITSLSFLVLFLLVSCVSSSSKLVKSGDGNDWVKFDDNDYGNYSYKIVNIDKNNGNHIVQVWEKHVFSNKGREKYIQKMTKKEFPTEGYDKLSVFKGLYEIDCKKQMKKTLYMMTYDKDSNVLDSKDYKAPEWDYVIPDTMGDILRTKVCK